MTSNDGCLNSVRDKMTRRKMDQFTLAYITAALWSTNDESTPSGGEPLDNNYDLDDIANDTVQRIISDCRKFQENNAETLEPFDLPRAGHDFWLTRNGHGAGFWDGDYPEPAATVLTDASKAFGEFDLYLGDDKKIYHWMS